MLIIGSCGCLGSLCGFISIIIFGVVAANKQSFASSATEEQCNIYDISITDCYKKNCQSGITVEYYGTVGSKCGNATLMNDSDYGTCACTNTNNLEGLGIQKCYTIGCDEFSFNDWGQSINDIYLGLGISIAAFVVCLFLLIFGIFGDKW